MAEDFTASYVLVGIGILVEVARRLGMGFIALRNELAAEKAAKKPRKPTTPASSIPLACAR